MGTNSKTMPVIGREEVISPEVDLKRHISEKKGLGLIARVRNLIGRVVTVDEDWMLKSKDWPYMWKKK